MVLQGIVGMNNTKKIKILRWVGRVLGFLAIMFFLTAFVGSFVQDVIIKGENVSQ
jgi:hypothetical protein